MVHVAQQGTDWWANILSGVVGAVIGTLGAFGAALLVLRSDRNTDKAQRKQRLAEIALPIVLSARRIIPTVSSEDTPEEVMAKLSEIRDSLNTVSTLMASGSVYVGGVKLAEVGMDLVELRLDKVRRAESLQLLQMTAAMQNVTNQVFDEVSAVLAGKHEARKSG